VLSFPLLSDVIDVQYFSSLCRSLCLSLSIFTALSNPYDTRSDEFQKSWEESLNLMCSEIEACKGATELVEELAKAKLPMAIATSSRYVAVEKKQQR
jgi:beta-phosphoglucomutase-like phosphatase (HAD superfamily)